MTVPSNEELRLLHANICKALGDPKRIQILYTLNEAPCNVTTLAECLDAPQPTVSRHLAILRERGLVLTERDGVMVNYSIADPKMIEVLDEMRDLLRRTMERRVDLLS
jgi:ArsR family transcriptional regulator